MNKGISLAFFSCVTALLTSCYHGPNCNGCMDKYQDLNQDCDEESAPICPSNPSNWYSD
jgi:hypothetical protein